MRAIHENVMSQTAEQRDDVVCSNVALSCPRLRLTGHRLTRFHFYKFLGREFFNSHVGDFAGFLDAAVVSAVPAERKCVGHAERTQAVHSPLR